MRKKIAKKEALFYENMLKEEINKDRKERGKKELKDKDDDPSGGTGEVEKEVKESTSDPESGWFHKGEHRQVFAYSIAKLVILSWCLAKNPSLSGGEN